jgi:hypothetical protein
VSTCIWKRTTNRKQEKNENKNEEKRILRKKKIKIRRKKIKQIIPILDLKN